MAGRVIGQGLRSWNTLWLLLAAVAVLSRPPPRPPPPTPEDLVERLRSDPAVAAADEAVTRAFDAARPNSAAPHDLLRLRAGWDNTHLSDGTVAASLSTDAAMLDRIRAFEAFWAAERARTYDRDGLAGRCATVPPDPPCRVQGAASPVPGSGDTLFTRVARRGDLPHGTVFDALLAPEVMDVFQAAGPDAWHFVLRVAYDPGQVPRRPRQVATPAGTVLVLPPASRWSVQVGEVEGGDQVYLKEGSAWRRLDTASWLRAAAASLPPHQCLLQTSYNVAHVPLSTELEPDYATLTLLGLYGPRSGDLDRISGQVAFRFAIENGVLVLRQSVLTPYADTRRWWQRWLEPGPQC